MPEGHTLRRIADRLGPALAGRVVTGFESRRPELEDGTLARLVATASRLLRAGVTSQRRPSVYGRTRRPCVRCGAPIVSRRHGPLRRNAYWCPTCQPETLRG